MKTFLLTWLLPVWLCAAPELNVVQLPCVLAWDKSDGSASYIVEYQKMGSAVVSQFPIKDADELPISRFPSGIYTFWLIGVTADGGLTDRSNELTLVFQ